MSTSTAITTAITVATGAYTYRLFC
ncbi:hypothetical protein YPPY61_4736, partial [Yersinia pestis PY-61]